MTKIIVLSILTIIGIIGLWSFIHYAKTKDNTSATILSGIVTVLFIASWIAIFFLEL